MRAPNRLRREDWRSLVTGGGWTIAALLLAAAGVRIAVYLVRPPLWIDEARLALNIGRLSWLGLLGTLDHDQAAPVPFLWAVSLTTRLVGMNEWGLRLVPTLTGLALIPVTFLVARNLVGRAAGLVSMALVAGSPLLIRYGNEVKQYGPDALATLAVLWLAQRVRHLPDADRAWVGLGLGGMVLLWCSQPVPLVLAAVGGALVLDPGVRARDGWWWRCGALAAAWLASFALLYFLSYRAVGESTYMQAFWGGTFLDPTAPGFVNRVQHAFRSVLVAPFAGPEPGYSTKPFVLLAAAGAVLVLWRRGWSTAVLIGGPFLTLFIASAFHKYPIAPRLTVFLSPLVLMLCATVPAAVLGWLGRWQRHGHLALVAGAVLLGGRTGKQMVWRTTGEWNARTLVRALQESPGSEPAYVYAGAIPMYAFYSTDWHQPDRARLAFVARATRADGPAFTNLLPRGRPVVCAGDELVTRHQGRLELWGLGAGIRVVAPVRAWPQVTDTGWAANEVRRMWETGAERINVLSVYMQPAWRTELLEAARNLGAVVEASRVANRERPWSMIYSIRFPRGAGAVADSTRCPSSAGNSHGFGALDGLHDGTQ